MPFIDIAINFQTIHTNQYYQIAFDFFDFTNDVNFVIFSGFMLLGFYVFRGIVNMLYVYLMASFSLNLYSKTIKRLFNIYLAIPYQVFATKNSSQLTRVVITEASMVFW